MQLKNLILSPKAGLATGLVGLFMALISALGINKLGVPSADWAAQVNGIIIPISEYERALIAMQDGLKRPLTENDKTRALQILIDEELLLQEAIELGLTHFDPSVKKNLIQAMMKASTNLTETLPTTPALKAFYETEKNFFTKPLMLSVIAVSTESEPLATSFLNAIKHKEDFLKAAARLKFNQQSIPVQIPIGKLSDYLGGDMAQKIVSYEQGSIMGPIKHQGKFKFFWLTEKSGGLISFDDIYPLVKAEWKRRQNEEAFKFFIENLRARARIKTAQGTSQ